MKLANYTRHKCALIIKRMRSFIYKIYAFRFLNGLMFIYPLYSVMFQDAGLTPFQISLLIVVWAVTIFLLQVPSGALADKYSRKYILVFAQIMKIAAFLTWMLAPSFWGFFAGFVLWGVQGAFMSGTFEAILYDELNKYGQKKEYTKIYGRSRTAEFTGVILASALATPIFGHGGYELILIGSIALIIFSIAALLLLPNVKNEESTHEQDYFKLLKEGAKVAVHTPILLRLIIFLALVMALSGPINDYYGIFIRDIGISTKNIGIFVAVAGIADVLGSLIAHKFKHHRNSRFYALYAVSGVILLAATIMFNYAGLVLLILYGFVNRIIKTVFEGKLQDEIPPGVRATVSSVYGFSTEMGIIVLTLSFGYIAQQHSVHDGFYLISVIMIALGMLYIIQKIVRVNILHVKDHHITQQLLERYRVKTDNSEIELPPPHESPGN